MNLLIFVSVLLMVLASMSYSEIRTYFAQTLAQSAWVRYMEGWETCAYNEAIGVVYDGVPRNKNGRERQLDSVGNPADPEDESPQGDAKGEERNIAPSAARINFRILIGQQDNVDPRTYEQYASLTKALLNQIYGEQDFLKQAKSERPNILDDLLAALKELSDEKKIGNTKGLDKIKLSDPELDHLLYTFLRKTPLKGAEKVCEEVSLFQFLSEKSSQKIRVNIAPKPLLLAIFGDPETVEKVIKDSDDLYKEVKNKKMDSEAATTQLKAAFGNSSDFSDILDFTVNTSNPKDYR